MIKGCCIASGTTLNFDLNWNGTHLKNVHGQTECIEFLGIIYPAYTVAAALIHIVKVFPRRQLQLICQFFIRLDSQVIQSITNENTYQLPPTTPKSRSRNQYSPWCSNSNWFVIGNRNIESTLPQEPKKIHNKLFRIRYNP